MLIIEINLKFGKLKGEYSALKKIVYSRCESNVCLKRKNIEYIKNVVTSDRHHKLNEQQKE